ncbi:MAG TPA: acetate--CoA ligase family protein [Hypericibacter adhaerens]|jgi:acetyltransferase|uniref:Acetyl-CoA synthetase n=1 Tax=Hypericibacter adhaerens TaxID=2602016 RepID=A0A5J6N3H8_9PROT|nr:acetate--CoA ligase family protein [Hypericibacter adhaerens]QEX24498.1 acetyl-CoA synthetase [Hypericibacter adhaerens]HWA42846.1 acetate--CoA ligase family protein [Hypericibacter adhaerens]
MSDPVGSGRAAHRLAPLLDARSIAVVGASERANSFGLRLSQAVLSAGYEGQISFVNPKQDSILGRRCHRSIAELEHAPDLAILGVGAVNLEAALLAAIERGARSAVIFDACHGEAAAGGPLLARLRDIAHEARIPVCGGAGMGLVNLPTRCVASFYPAGHLKPGGITLIAHSGSVFTVLAMNDPRYRFDLMVSPGQEIGATADEYIDYAIGRPTTKVIALFLETARNPQGFLESLRRAQAAHIPVVICKVGRCEQSARMARSHTGALAGSSAAYVAAIEECGAIAVEDVDQLMNVAQLCAGGRLPGPGGVGLVTDSGGLRELVTDRATEIGAPLAELGPPTIAALRGMLPPSLEPSNPLDCAAELTDEFAAMFERGLVSMADAPEVSMIGFEADLRDDYVYMEELRQLALRLPALTTKPCFFYSSFSRANNRSLADALADHGVPCLNGAGEMLLAAKKVQEWADRRREQPRPSAQSPAASEAVESWRTALRSDHLWDERRSLDLLSAFGIKTIRSEIAENWEGLAAAGRRIGYPLVLKTAAIGIDHKSDRDGVHLGLTDQDALRCAYDDLSGRLGPRVIVQAMAGKGVELGLGCVLDPDFGPLVMVSAGGTLIELFCDRQFALAPFDEHRALRMIERLAVARTLNGVRGAPAKDKRSAARALADFSIMCASLGSAIAEADVNPLIVSETGAVAVDALLVPAAR